MHGRNRTQQPGGPRAHNRQPVCVRGRTAATAGHRASPAQGPGLGAQSGSATLQPRVSG